MENIETPASQTSRLIALFKQNPNRELSSVQLHQAASGKINGYCASMSRRITDCRKQGLNIPAPRKTVTESGQVHTFYTYKNITE